MIWEKTKIRCSSIAAIMCEPQAKAAKDAGELSKTAKTHLINVYIKEKYKRERDFITPAMLKGIESEERGITLLSLFKEQFLKKNDLRLENDFLSGHPDIFEGEDIFHATHITDTKLSWDIWTFLPNILDPLNKDYAYQLQGYFDLTTATKGTIAYLLVDTPENIINSEKYKLLRQMNVVTEESPEFVEAAKLLEANMIYPDVPINEKVLLFHVDRDDEVIEKIHGKVEKCREFLSYLESKHLSFNKVAELAKAV
jgi:hypothetical protein